MSFIITGTDTNVGKTVIASWLALQLGCEYWKPIQTGEESDSRFVERKAHAKTHAESYTFKAPLAPWIAARLEGRNIDLDTIQLPTKSPLIIEGAGGLFVPLSENQFMIDLFKKLGFPVIVVARTSLGTINHTLLSLAALRAYGIPIQGVIMNGEKNSRNKEAIETCGKVPVIAEFPWLNEISYEILQSIPIVNGEAISINTPKKVIFP